MIAKVLILSRIFQNEWATFSAIKLAFKECGEQAVKWTGGHAARLQALFVAWSSFYFDGESTIPPRRIELQPAPEA
jgi:hypothetical protein